MHAKFWLIWKKFSSCFVIKLLSSTRLFFLLMFLYPEGEYQIWYLWFFLFILLNLIFSSFIHIYNHLNCSRIFHWITQKDKYFWFPVWLDSILKLNVEKSSYTSRRKALDCMTSLVMFFFLEFTAVKILGPN